MLIPAAQLIGVLVAGTLFCEVSAGQPTFEVLYRVRMIESQFGRGTAFALDVDGREYWVTAKHILTGKKGPPWGTIAEKEIGLRMMNPKGNGLEWIPIKFTVLQAPENVDVVVLAPPRPLVETKLTSPGVGSPGMMWGGNCEFLGFAYGGGWQGRFVNGESYWLPYLKRCTVSGQDVKSGLWILDGINNVGFSGGPVIYGTGAQLKVVAVISGYMTEPAEVIRGKTAEEEAKRDVVNVNSGFILAYDISHAMDLIRKDPIGPRLQGDDK